MSVLPQSVFLEFLSNGVENNAILLFSFKNLHLRKTKEWNGFQKTRRAWFSRISYAEGKIHKLYLKNEKK